MKRLLNEKDCDVETLSAEQLAELDAPHSDATQSLAFAVALHDAWPALCAMALRYAKLKAHPAYYIRTSDPFHRTVIECAISKLDAALSAHTDHPLRHFDRTCPACIAEEQR